MSSHSYIGDRILLSLPERSEREPQTYPDIGEYCIVYLDEKRVIRLENNLLYETFDLGILFGKCNEKHPNIFTVSGFGNNYIKKRNFKTIDILLSEDELTEGRKKLLVEESLENLKDLKYFYSGGHPANYENVMKWFTMSEEEFVKFNKEVRPLANCEIPWEKVPSPMKYTYTAWPKPGSSQPQY